MPNAIKNYFTKEKVRQLIKNSVLIVVASILMAAANSFILLPFSIVTGGIAGITILLADFIDPVILNYILYWGLFVAGLIFLGIKFSASTLLSTILIPVFTNIFLKTGIQEHFVKLVLSYKELQIEPIIVNGVITNLSDLTSSATPGFLLIMGLLTGLLTGAGCALCFKAGASTGGVDIITLLISKYTGIKESVPFFLIDASVVAVNLIVNVALSRSAYLIPGLIGIISACISSQVVHIIYNNSETSYVIDVISKKYREIADFSIKDLDRSATIFTVEGGYSGEEKKMVRIEVSRREYVKVRQGIAKIDPKAFSTFYSALFIGGEGFERIGSSKESLIKTIKKHKKDGK